MTEKGSLADKGIYFQTCFFGTMYIVEDPQSGRRVFRQTITQEEIEQMDPAISMQFKRFLAHLAKSGPHELVFIRTEESEHGISIYYEYCIGLTLYDKLKRLGSSFSISETFSALNGILAYFYYYEDKGGVFHRDVKLENIFIDQYSNIKIGGQDLAEFGGVKSGSIAGSISYLAPEVFAAIRKTTCDLDLTSHPITEKTEIFALGILTLELLTGYNFFRNPIEEKLKEPKSLLEILQQMEDVQQMAQRALDNTALVKIHANFYSVIKSMLEPFPERRCNFVYLYDFFGFKNQIRRADPGRASIKPDAQLDSKIGILCDPNILLVAETRKLFFMRVDHEFCLIQFILYSAKETWDLANFNFRNEEYFDEKIRSEFLVVSCCLALKAMIYLDNLRNGLKAMVNVFNIRYFEVYAANEIFAKDREFILQRIHIPDDSPVKVFFALILEKLESLLSEPGASTHRLTVYLQPQVTKEKKLRSISDTAKQSIKIISNHKSLQILQILFEKFLRLIEDCFQEELKFRFCHPTKGVFNWEEFLETRYPQLKTKIILRRVTLPRTSTTN